MALRASLAFVLANLLTVTAAWVACRRGLHTGTQLLPSQSDRDGRSLFILLAAASLLFYGDRFIVARLCSVEDFAAYNLVATFFQVFDLLNMSLGFLLPSLFARDATRSSRRIFRSALLVLVPVALAGMLVVPWVIAWGFPHFPAFSLWMVAGLSLAGAAKVLNGVVMANLNQHASSEALRGYTLQNLVLVGGGMVAIALAAHLLGPAGASIAVGAVWIARTLLALRAESRLERVAVPA